MGEAAYLAFAQDATAKWFVRRVEEGHRVLVAEEDGTIVGLSVDGPNTLDAPAERELRNVYVEPAITSCGIGHALVLQTLDAMRTEGTKTVSLGVFPTNLRAIAFYERLGFVRHRVSTWTNNEVEFADQIMLRDL